MGIRRWIALVLGIVALWSGAVPSHTNTASPIRTPRVIRFRVIANSDNPVDQAIKLDVRDRVLETLDPRLNGVTSRAVASQRIQAMQGQISQVANHVLHAHHVSYRATVSWTRTKFPTKAYGSWVLPAGRYQALLVTLGQGQGHNWWCVLFPSLCFVDMGNALAVHQPQIPASTVPASVRSVPSTHSAHHVLRPRSGRIRVSWTTPRVLKTFLAILR